MPIFKSCLVGKHFLYIYKLDKLFTHYKHLILKNTPIFSTNKCAIIILILIDNQIYSMIYIETSLYLLKSQNHFVVNCFLGIGNIVACITLALTGSLKLNRFILFGSSILLMSVGIFIAPFATTKVRHSLLKYYFVVV